MEYSAYRLFRDQVLKEDPNVLDLGQTNIWRALAQLIPPESPQHGRRIHRCHLAQQWCEVYDLPGEYAEDAMISTGVRHSLSLLLPEVASRNLDLCIPSDVYPVYGQIAEASGLAPSTFPTANHLALPEVGDWLLLPNPIKPAGRWLSGDDITALRKWLNQSPRRRLLLDTVYNLQPEIHPSTLTLFSTGQVFVLHSLSKAWLRPQVMGVCLTPAVDREWAMPIFSDQAPEQSQLRVADHLLRKHTLTPNQVDHAIQASRSHMLDKLPPSVADHIRDDDAVGYFTIVDTPHTRLLQDHSILAIPLTVFGSHSTKHSVLSSLAFV